MDGASLPNSTAIRRAACPSRAARAGPAAERRPPARPAEIATRFVVRLVACATQADEAAILGLSRGTANVARARHIAMYLLHTSLSIPYGDVGARFSRDRTTVSHACRIVEDLRDDPALDAFIARLEETVELAGSMASARWHVPGGAGRGGGA